MSMIHDIHGFHLDLLCSTLRKCKLFMTGVLFLHQIMVVIRGAIESFVVLHLWVPERKSSTFCARTTLLLLVVEKITVVIKH